MDGQKHPWTDNPKMLCFCALVSGEWRRKNSADSVLKITHVSVLVILLTAVSALGTIPKCRHRSK